MAFGSSWLDRVAGPSRLHSVRRVSDHVQDRHTSSVTIKELITMNLSREESQWQRRTAPSGPACDCSSSSSDSTTDTNNNNLPSSDNVKHCTTMSDTPASLPLQCHGGGWPLQRWANPSIEGVVVLVIHLVILLMIQILIQRLMSLTYQHQMMRTLMLGAKQALQTILARLLTLQTILARLLTLQTILARLLR